MNRPSQLYTTMFIKVRKFDVNVKCIYTKMHKYVTSTYISECKAVSFTTIYETMYAII